MTEVPVASYQDLKVWQLSMSLAEACYEFTATFPREETYGLTSQIRRAAVSIAANIAEGYGRDQTGGFIQFLRISMGSARELETLVLLARRVGATSDLAKAETLLGTCSEVSKMLRAMIRSLEYKRSPS